MLKNKRISILLIIFVIFGMISSSSVRATVTDININNGGNILDVKWKRTKEPTNDSDFINTMDDSVLNNVYKADEYIPVRTGQDEIIFSSENLGEGEHILKFAIAGDRNPQASKSDGYISYANIFTKYDDTDPIKVDAIVNNNETNTINKFVFSSGWNQEGTKAWAGVGNSFTIKFVGEKIELYGIKDPNHGIMDITIDGKSYYSEEVIDGKVYKVLDNYPGKGEGILPGKVITTPRGIYTGEDGNRLLLDYNVLTEALNPTATDNVWDSKGGLYYEGYITNNELPTYPVEEFATWKHYGSGDSWRLFEGEFQLDLTAADMTNKRVYLGVLGENGPQLIMPLNDFMIVLVDGKPTDINFTTQDVNNNNSDNIKLRLADGEIYTPTFKQAYHQYSGSKQCTNQNHTSISTHTHTWHAHLNNQAESSDEGYRLGDITPFLQGNGSHKIQVLCADNAGGGGGTKLDVFIVESPNMEVVKSGFVINGENGNRYELEAEGKSTVYPGESVYYNFSMINTGKETLNSLRFTDDLVGIKVDKTGIYKDKVNVTSDSLKITKISSTNEETIKTGKAALKLLESIGVNETIIVEDMNNIKYDVSSEDLNREDNKIINTVKAKARYLNNQLKAESEAGFKVSVAELAKPNLNLNKKVYEVKRDGEVIYSLKDNPEGNKVPGLYPKDEVSFGIEIENLTRDEERPYNKDLPITDLKLEDFLSDSNIEDTVISNYTTPEWIFTAVGRETFDSNNFDLAPKEKLTVIANSYVVQEPYNIEEDGKVNIWDYKIINTVNLYKELLNGTKEIWTNTAEVDILPPKLYLKKEVTIAEGIKLGDKDEDMTFTINVSGSDNTSFTIEAVKDNVYTINNLKYGITYSTSEVVPANYQLVGIEIQELNNSNNVIFSGSSFILDSDKAEECIVVKNNLINNKYFYDSEKKTNIFKYPLNSNKQ